MQPQKIINKLTEKDISYGLVRENELYRGGLNGAKPILLKEVSEESEEETIAHYKARFEKVQSQFTELENRILGTENKGSFLAKLVNLKNLLAIHDGLGDYDSMYAKITLYENQITDVIKSNRQRNTEIKNALLLELEEALKNNDFHEVGLAIKDIKLRWLKTGSADAALKEEIETRFTELTQSFFDKRQSFFDDKKMLVESRKGKYDAVIAVLEKIIGKGDLQRHVAEIGQLQKDWKEIGHIPESEYKVRNTKYWELCNLFYNELKKNRKKYSEKEDYKGNLKLKQAVLDQLKEQENESLHSDIKTKLEEAKKVWKTIGKVPRGEVDNLNTSYMDLLDSISERIFIYQLASRKFKGFTKKDVEERNKLLIKVVNDLLYRDKNELETFKENMDNMHVNKGSFVDMLEKKLIIQEKRVSSKQAILKSLKA